MWMEVSLGLRIINTGNKWFQMRRRCGTSLAGAATTMKHLLRPMLLKRRELLLNLVLVLTVGSSVARGANWYVRPGGAGAKTGIDWNNAWDCGGIGWSGVNGGDTIWLAGGTYGSSIVPGKSGSAGALVFVKRVLSTDSVPAAAAGWQPSFDSQVIVNASPTIYYKTAGLGSYMYWDGRVDAGIKLQFGDVSSPAYCGAVFCGNTGPGGQTQVTFTNIDMSGPFAGTAYQATQNQTGPLCLYNVSYFTITHCRLHGAPDCMGLILASSYVTLDHCKIYDGDCGGTGAHENVLLMWGGVDQFTMRYCEVWNWPVMGFSLGAGVGAMYLYGNIWHNPSGTSSGMSPSPRFIETSSSFGTSGATGPLYCYNNTIVDLYGTFTTSSSAGYWVSGSITRNNIVWNGSTWNSANAPSDQDYDYGNAALSGSHSINGTGASPFIGGTNYHVVATVAANYPRNKGVAIPNVAGHTFNIDMDGNIRGADGAWDMGAYEYGSLSTNAIISVSPSSLAFGSVGAGTNATNYFTVQNVGGSLLAGNVSISGGTDFTIISGQSYSLGANQSVQVGVRYTPSKASDAASITFAGGGGASAPVSGQQQVVMSGLSFPAYAGSISAPFTTNSEGYISQSVGSGVTDGGVAIYALRISEAGSYTVAANVNAPDEGANSFYVNIDAMPTDPTMIWDITVTGGFVSQTASWRGNGSNTAPQYSPQVFSLSAGVHQLYVVGREANTELGQITVSPYSARPNAPSPPGSLRVLAVQ
jgi:hypothetical protein